MDRTSSKWIVDHGRVVKKIFEIKLERRRKGRSRLRWLEDVRPRPSEGRGDKEWVECII